ncbi:ATP-binding cassette domain-containing protein [soil metagenome]
MSTKPIIEIKQLTTGFGKEYILNKLDLDIYKGEILAIVGGSGSGKTTLLRSVLMLQSVNSGSIKILGHEAIGCSPKQAQQLQRQWGVLFQHNALFSSLTVFDNIAFPLQESTELTPGEISSLVQLKLALVGLAPETANKYPSELSGGMEKRAALARAIALDPHILFLDEPTTGLDPVSAGGLDELVLNLRETLGLTVVMITHDLDTLWQAADRVAFLGNGKVLAVDTIENLTQSSIPLVHAYFSSPRARIKRRS